jgi:N-acetylmuramoyl-L-alanine amidase
MTILDRPSPNHNERGGPVELLILHYTGMQSAETALERLCDPAAKVSAHYLIDEAGQIYALVDEDRRAWHAGQGFWRGITDINGASIGIELANPGHEWGYRPFPPPQMTALIDLAQGIVARHAIRPRDVIGHSDIAPARKEDPGELFDWAGLAAHGLGLYPHAFDGDDAPLLKPGDEGPEVATLQRDLARYGYGLAETGRYDVKSFAAVTAFQRHFHPGKLDGVWTAGCQHALDWLLAQIG